MDRATDGSGSAQILGPWPTTPASNFYLGSTHAATYSPSDNLRILDVLFEDVGITSLFSDWPYTTNTFVQCVRGGDHASEVKPTETTTRGPVSVKQDLNNHDSPKDPAIPDEKLEPTEPTGGEGISEHSASDPGKVQPTEKSTGDAEGNYTAIIVGVSIGAVALIGGVGAAYYFWPQSKKVTAKKHKKQ